MDRRPGLSAKNILAACEESLDRLQTDYIDLYYSHSDDETVSLEETLGAYAQLIAEGKVRYIAASNFTAARLRESVEFSHANNLPSYIAVQDLYNLIVREGYEKDLAPTVADLGITNLPYYGIARGFLSGKYRPGVTEVDSKRAAGAREHANDKNFAVLAAMDEISAAHNDAPLSAIALAWLRSQPTVSAPISSARTVAQLEEIVQVIHLTADEVEKLNTLSA
jgi:aryl-alcohol dehydrogenase-like predicted oxidoreductase